MYFLVVNATLPAYLLVVDDHEDKALAAARTSGMCLGLGSEAKMITLVESWVVHGMWDASAGNLGAGEKTLCLLRKSGSRRAGSVTVLLLSPAEVVPVLS